MHALDKWGFDVSIYSSRFKLNTFYIYNDEGASESGVSNLKQTLSLDGMISPYLIQEINATQIIGGEWKTNAAAFLMPGGADLPYCKKLNGLGNKQIKEYVESGGIYIGFCAGAYYGARYCDFHRGDHERGYEVLGERELSFFSGSAVGPTLAPYTYGSENGARIADIEWVHDVSLCNRSSVYFNGGCHFPDIQHYDNITVLARYNNKNAKGFPAIIECRVKKGKAILSGVHPEDSVENLQRMYDTTSDNYQTLTKRIIPKLMNRSHVYLFRLIMSRI